MGDRATGDQGGDRLGRLGGAFDHAAELVEPGALSAVSWAIS